jgi:serine/threonine-protein kinase
MMAEGDRSQPPLPKVIGRYQIQGGLGTGAMGAVYKGFDPLIKRTLAIKTIRLDIARGSEEYKTFLERFYQEARISGTLSHPNIVTLFDIGEDNGLPFLALEFIEGETVESMLGRGVKFRPEKVIGLISQIAAALDYAHSKGVIHRDIKPANLLVYEEDRVKVTDFGIAKLADVEMTKVGQLLGTPSYMSPEQAMGEKLDGRSDIFSLGVCAFEMLCGKQPFPGNNVTAILYRLVHMEPIEPDNLEMNGLIPQKWHEVFPKVLSKKRESRYQTAAEFVRDLEFCLGSWFTGLGEDLVPTESVPLPSIAATPAAPRPAAAAPPPLAARQADDPSVVVSMDEIQAAMPRVASPPAASEDDELPATIAMSIPKAAKKKEESMPPTLSVPPPPAEDEDDMPATIAVERPSIPQEKTIVLPAPSAAGVGSAGVPPPPAEPASPAAVSKPSSKPPFRPGTVPAYRPPTPLSSRSQPPRIPGPASQVPGPAVEVGETEKVAKPRVGLPVVPVVVGGIAMLLLAIVLAVVAARRGQGSGGTTTSTQPAAPAGNGEIRVQTTPAGATVKLYDVARGIESATLTGLAPGTYEVIAELSGSEPAFQRVTLKDGDRPVEVSLTLEPSKSTMSEADILSRPAGATVFLDGRKIGLAPLRGLKLRVGNRRFRLTTDGYEPFAEFLRVEEGKTARLDARMVPIGSSPPPVTPSAEAATPAPVTEPTPTPAPPTTTLRPRPTPAPTTTTLAAAPAPPPTTTTLAPAPKPPVVDPAKVYLESDVDTAPRKLSGDTYQPKLKSGETLSVTMSWVVTENGEVVELEVVESGGKALDDGMLQALRKWKYAAGVKQGTKVKVKMLRKYTFRAG